MLGFLNPFTENIVFNTPQTYVFMLRGPFISSKQTSIKSQITLHHEVVANLAKETNFHLRFGKYHIASTYQDGKFHLQLSKKWRIQV